MNEGLEPDPNPIAAEHTEPWPGGPLQPLQLRSQIATGSPSPNLKLRAVKALKEWYPVVFVDLHEMGTDSTYYFAPEAVPYNPHLTKDQKEPGSAAPTPAATPGAP